MSQFTNMYNGQNGMGASNQNTQYSPGQNYPGNWGPPTNQPVQPSTVDPNQAVFQQGWKPYVPQQSIPVLGRWVNNFDEIKPQEVKMDGNLYLFPQEDRECIYARFWDNDGNLRTYRFLPERIESQPQQPAFPDLTGQLNRIGNDIFGRIDELERNLNGLVQSIQSPPEKPVAKTSRTTTTDKGEK